MNQGLSWWEKLKGSFTFLRIAAPVVNKKAATTVRSDIDKILDGFKNGASAIADTSKYIVIGVVALIVILILGRR